MDRRVSVGVVSLLGVLVAAMALYVAFGTVAPAHSGASAAAAVESDFKASEADASSAPQQQVVAGWAAKDALEAQLRQTDTLINQNAVLRQLTTSVVLLLAGACLLLTAIVIALLWGRERPRATPKIVIS
jgi:hypothetical protein